MRKQKPSFILMIPIALIAFVTFILILLPSENQQAHKIVDQFYSAEQEADFDSSWELLHSEMKNKFSKSAYMQDRVHTFMSHFGADTFTYSMTKPKKIKSWKMTKDAKPMEAYEVVVTKEYNGKYGHFNFVQYVYVSLDGEQPAILWDYKEKS
ncbi:hypothetical protein [Alkalihalobacillus deserti]|uniref:hypothetical protein n=1 Tax=Alkalihalobacillus deserti TaxID=2879466 RepID=UPI001D1551E7|nr:hypothetical protein [Alkalihalobacillus deserti]